jgi:hypothetical protein|uniref:Uncharacterized protein n=1 Tax=viral metagenome TaxID=1070528 RepID=A0A6C0BXY4_9ZZZZ
MKLTKGKLIKLYDKKKQTMKKYKTTSQKSTEKNKSFKNKKAVNLHNTTLKHLEI